MTQRRYDIDLLRVIAIGLLIIYHVSIAFQPWGGLIGFLQDKENIDWIWYPMAMLNMWRIPILFFVAGMGVYFSMQRRNLIKLMLERTQRIAVPFLFGMFTLVPLHILIFQQYYYQEPIYKAEMSHLWFLQNIFVYTLVLAPLAFLARKRKAKKIIRKIQKYSSQALVFLVATLSIVAGTYLVKPDIYTLYAYSIHGWVLGFIAFSIGFYIVSLGKEFWTSLKVWKWIYLIIALFLYLIRILKYDFNSSYFLSATETTSWVFAVFGFFYHYGNKPSRSLSYFSQAAYPVYIIHMLVQYGLSALIFPMGFPVNINLLILVILTLALSLAVFHFIIRPVKWIRPLFGMNINYKLNNSKRNAKSKESDQFVYQAISLKS